MKSLVFSWDFKGKRRGFCESNWARDLNEESLRSLNVNNLKISRTFSLKLIICSGLAGF
jgi:hypothetical protein